MSTLPLLLAGYPMEGNKQYLHLYTAIASCWPKEAGKPKECLKVLKPKAGVMSTVILAMF